MQENDNISYDLNPVDVAKRRLERARSLFDTCDSDNEKLFDYANAEVTAAEKYLDYVLSCKV